MIIDIYLLNIDFDCTSSLTLTPIAVILLFIVIRYYYVSLFKKLIPYFTRYNFRVNCQFKK